VIPISDVIPVSPWHARELRDSAPEAREAGVQVLLAERVRDAERLRGVSVCVEGPDGRRRDWLVSGVEVLRGSSMLFLAGATPADVPPGSQLEWDERDP
jgi:hypothetical protein